MDRQETITTLQHKAEMIRMELRTLEETIKVETNAEVRKSLKAYKLLSERELEIVENALISLGKLPKGVT